MGYLFFVSVYAAVLRTDEQSSQVEKDATLYINETFFVNHVQIPVSGTFDKPKVDWKTAGVGLAQLTARQRGGQLMQTFLNYVDTNEKSDVPEPGSKLPWEQSSAEHAQ